MKFIVTVLATILIAITFVFVVASIIELFKAVDKLLDDKYENKIDFYNDAFLIKKLISKIRELK